LFSSPGKTEALGEYIAERAGTQPGLRVLVISFRRVLADKMVGELRRAGCDLDFVKYQDIQKRPSFNSDLLVVQLDSLYRVEQKLYDIVVLDECQSITDGHKSQAIPHRSQHTSELPLGSILAAIPVRSYNDENPRIDPGISDIDPGKRSWDHSGTRGGTEAGDRAGIRAGIR
jgi:superfamily II DNA or RNA helicase